MTLGRGDVVTRMLAGTIPMRMRVSRIDTHFIHCGSYKFDLFTGAEVDEMLGWGSPPLMTGSFIILPLA